jgi:hypothetical protein
MRLTRLLGAALLVLSALASTAFAQQPATHVAPPGVMRFGVGGIGAFADARFGSAVPADSAGGSGRTPLSVPVAAVLVDSTYAPLSSLQQTLNTFFAATDSVAGAPFRASAETLRLTASAVRARAEERVVPFELELGLLPRISVVARGSVVRDDLRAGRLAVSGGTVGVNPDRAYNIRLMTSLRDSLGAGAVAVGGSALLPVAGSPAGEALQARVRAAAGDGRELRLPAGPAAEVALEGFAAADQFSVGPFSPDSMRWSAGDSEVGARVQLLDVGARRTGVRAVAEGGARLATGQAPGAAYLVFPVPERGMSGAFARLAADLLLSPSVQLSAAAGWERLGGVTLERRVWSTEPGADGLPTFTLDTLRWEPGSRVTLAVAPTLRPVEEIGIFARYGYVQRQGESLGGVGLARSAQQWGAGVEFSTLRPYAAGRTPVPFTASIAYRQTFAGSGGEPAARALELRGSLYLRLWGGR